MVLHFPSKLTEEEQQLQSKYAKLRRKKKQLQVITIRILFQNVKRTTGRM
jgi:hypothetical protein